MAIVSGHVRIYLRGNLQDLGQNNVRGCMLAINHTNQTVHNGAGTVISTLSKVVDQHAYVFISS